VLYALEPAHEATFHANSYGFRTGRSAHDAQKILQLNLRSGCNGIEKRVIELDIEKCLRLISHSAIMDRLIAPKSIKTGIFRCLKAGVNPEFPEQGTPQGGVISPQKREHCAQWNRGHTPIGAVRRRYGYYTQT
jgi:retron-type reverse transcriptase